MTKTQILAQIKQLQKELLVIESTEQDNLIKELRELGFEAVSSCSYQYKKDIVEGAVFFWVYMDEDEKACCWGLTTPDEEEEYESQYFPTLSELVDDFKTHSKRFAMNKVTIVFEKLLTDGSFDIDSLSIENGFVRNIMVRSIEPISM